MGGERIEGMIETWSRGRTGVPLLLHCGKEPWVDLILRSKMGS